MILECKYVSDGNVKDFHLELSRFNIIITTGGNSIHLRYEPPVIEVDIYSSLKSIVSHVIDYSLLIKFFLRFSRMLKQLGVTLIAKHYGKTFLMLGRKGI